MNIFQIIYSKLEKQIQPKIFIVIYKIQKPLYKKKVIYLLTILINRILLYDFETKIDNPSKPNNLSSLILKLKGAKHTQAYPPNYTYVLNSYSNTWIFFWILLEYTFFFLCIEWTFYVTITSSIKISYFGKFVLRLKGKTNINKLLRACMNRQLEISNILWLKVKNIFWV